MNYIKELHEGEMISEVYLCKNKVVAKTKAGKTYYSLQLQDKTGTADAKIWELSNAIAHFEPMDYKSEDGKEWIGFDADMAKLVAEKLGVEVQFVEIDWDNKSMELDSKTIDVVWNGMTITDEVTAAMDCTNAYCNNAQVVVVSNK